MATVLTGAQVSPSGEPGPSAPLSEIWNVRQRSFNAIGNPNFEIDQRHVGALIPSIPTATFTADRWYTNTAGTMRFSAQQISVPVKTPGTSFRITNKVLRLTLTTAQPTLSSGHNFSICQNLEGIRLRELIDDVTSLSLLVRSSVANLKFSVSLSDWDGTDTTRTITYLCTLGTADTWTLISIPNIPLWDIGGHWGTTVGINGYSLTISLAAFTTTSSLGAWQSGAQYAATGMDNFASKALNSTFDLAFVQHEPGPQCTTLIDTPFTDNLRACQRYFAKSYSYEQTLGLYSPANSMVHDIAINVNYTAGSENFPVPMARIPTLTSWNSYVGGQSAALQTSDGIARGVQGPHTCSTMGFGGWILPSGSQPAAGRLAYSHYSAVAEL